MDKIVNDAHTSKLQTLQNYYAAEDVLVFDIERRFCANSFCFVKTSNILLHITAMGLIFLT
mgnify:CR=1 FL=1